jgi:hypothetical protein
VVGTAVLRAETEPIDGPPVFTGFAPEEPPAMSTTLIFMEMPLKSVNGRFLGLPAFPAGG